MAVETAPPVVAEPAELKRLNWVVVYSSSAATYVESAYKKLRPLVPSALLPTLVKVEDLAAHYGTPLLTSGLDTSEKLLKTADKQVDYVVLVTDKWLKLEPLREYHKENMVVFRDASEKYFMAVKNTSDKISVEHAKELAAKALDPDAAVQTFSDLWAKFSSIPTVSKVLQTASPLVQRGYSTFTQAHDVLVASPYYKRSVDLGASTLSWAATTTPYKLGASYLYPLVQPVADPALDKVSKSEVYNQTIKYWQPVTA